MDTQDVRLKALPFALRAADEEIAQELHLDLLEAGAATALAATAAGVEGECARGQALRHRLRQRGKKFAHPIVETEVKNGRGTRRAREERLINHDDIADAMRPADGLAGARFLLARLAFGLQQISVEHVVDESRFSRNRKRR